MISYKEGKIVGRGAFGVVREAVGSNGKLVIKLEDISDHSRCPHEYRIYSKLKGIVGIPKVVSLEKRDGSYALIMENAGVNIYSHFLNSGWWSHAWLKEMICPFVSILAYQMLTVLRSVHSKGVIHGDIQPSNFTVVSPKRGSELSIRLIDFGASFEEAALEEVEGPIQMNPFFASSQRIQSPDKLPSKVDDLVSLGYSLVFLVKGRLPWSAFVDSLGKIEDLEALCVTKSVLGADYLCQGLPSPYYDFLAYVLGLHGDSPEIDYNKYIRDFELSSGE